MRDVQLDVAGSGPVTLADWSAELRLIERQAGQTGAQPRQETVRKGKSHGRDAIRLGWFAQCRTDKAVPPVDSRYCRTWRSLVESGARRLCVAGVDPGAAGADGNRG